MHSGAPIPISLGSMGGKPMENGLKKRILEGEILDGAEDRIDANEKRVIAGFWKTLAKAAGKVPFAEELVACYYCAFDPATPNRVRAVLLAALAYFVLPLDAIPDFLAIFGFTDDVAVLGAVIAMMRGHISDSHRRLAVEKLAQLREMAAEGADAA